MCIGVLMFSSREKQIKMPGTQGLNFGGIFLSFKRIYEIVPHQGQILRRYHHYLTESEPFFWTFCPKIQEIYEFKICAYLSRPVFDGAVSPRTERLVSHQK